MREINKIAEGLFEKIRDRFEDVSLGDDKAKATQVPEKARFFNFDYTVDDVNLGNVTLSIIDETSLKVYFSKNISDDLDDEQRHDWYDFLRELRRFSKSNLLSFEPRDITRSTLKHRDIQQVSKADNTYSKDEVVAESLYGTRKSSYERKGPVRIIVRHSKPLDEIENRRARTHNISNIYLETQEGERFKLPVKSLRLGRALAQHLKQGGSMQDDLGRHICEIAEECAKLKPFLNNTRHRTFEDTETHAMVEAAFEYHGLLNNTLKRMTGKKGYQKCKEQFVATSTSYIPEVDTDEMKQRFEKRTFDDRLEEALPLVHKAYNMKKENKFAEQFENWADTIAEGTWAVPNTDEDVDKLIDILSNPLPVGVDGQNATNALYNLIGDDRLFDKFQEIANIDPEQDVSNLVADWLQDHLPNIYQQIENEIGDPDYPAEPTEYDVDEGNTYGSGDGGMDGVVYEEDEQDDDGGFEAIQSAIIRRIAHNHHELLMKLGPDGVLEAARDIAEFASPVEEIGTSDVSAWVAQIERDAGIEKEEVTEERDIEDDEQVCVYCGDPRDDKLGCCEENHFISKKEFDQDNEVNEAKDKVIYDPKTGKLTGWEHEGDWKKQTKKKDPVGKIHHMSDVARRRTEKMAKDETLEEAFERLVNEDTINVGDIIRKKDEPEIQGKVKRIDPDKYIIDVDGDEYHIAQANAEKIPKSLHEAVDLKQLIGQEVYVPSEGTTGKILKLAPGTGDETAAPGGPKFSNSIVIQLKNGRQTVAHFKDVTATKPGALQQFLDKVKSVVGVGTQPKYQPKSYGQVSDINTPKQFQKLAGLK
jgi:predicted RNA-binding protein